MMHINVIYNIIFYEPCKKKVFKEPRLKYIFIIFLFFFILENNSNPNIFPWEMCIGSKDDNTLYIINNNAQGSNYILVYSRQREYLGIISDKR